MNKSTYSLDDDSLIISCDDTVVAGRQFECRLSVNTSSYDTLSVNGTALPFSMMSSNVSRSVKISILNFFPFPGKLLCF